MVLLITRPAVSKAHQQGRDSPEFRVIHAIADGRRGRVMESVRRALSSIRDRTTLAAIAAAAAEGRAEQILALLGLSGEVAADFVIQMEDVTQELRTILLAAGTASVKALPRAVQSAIAFDGFNPRSVDFIRAYKFRLIRGIDIKTREGVRRAIQESFKEGIRPFDTATRIQNIVGLTARQAKMVIGHEELLITEGVPAAARKKRLATLSARLLRARALGIARTETIRAAVSGQQLLWQQAADEGFIDSTARQFWIVTPDDRLCPICKPIPGMNKKGVPLGAFFDSPVGAISGPTAHPQCRCALSLEGG